MSGRTHVLASALALALLLAGCLSAPQRLIPWTGASGGSGPEVEPQAWERGTWWGYSATFTGNRTFHIALVVAEVAPDHFVVGSNLSAGFFGLPFSGNVTRPHLNPVIAGEPWRLFDFPLADGKRWTYPFMGYTLSAEAHRVEIEQAGLPAHEGFHVTATAYGRTVAEYTYSPLAGWLTTLDLYEPSNGERLLHVVLEGLGSSFDEAYYVETPVYEFDARYPGVDTREVFDLEGSALRFTAVTVLKGTAGKFQVRLVSPAGTEALSDEVTGQGVSLTRQKLPDEPGRWRLDHLGLGAGALHVEVLAMKAVKADDGARPATPPPEVASGIDFPSLLAGAERAKAGGLPLALPALPSAQELI